MKVRQILDDKEAIVFVGDLVPEITSREHEEQIYLIYASLRPISPEALILLTNSLFPDVSTIDEHPPAVRKLGCCRLYIKQLLRILHEEVQQSIIDFDEEGFRQPTRHTEPFSRNIPVERSIVVYIYGELESAQEKIHNPKLLLA